MESKKIFIQIEDKPAQVSIRGNGKPYFNKPAAELMQIASIGYFKVAKGKNHKCIYLFPAHDANETLKVAKEGLFYTLSNAANLFRRLGFMRGNKYQVTTCTYKGGIIFKISL